MHMWPAPIGPLNSQCAEPILTDVGAVSWRAAYLVYDFLHLGFFGS